VKNSKIVVFTCNWNAYSGLDKAGSQKQSYAAGVRPVKVACLDRLGVGNILKPFEKGADGVLLLGCPKGECHFRDQTRTVEKVFYAAKQLSRILGYGDERLQLDWVAADDGQGFSEQIAHFIGRLNQESK